MRSSLPPAAAAVPRRYRRSARFAQRFCRWTGRGGLRTSRGTMTSTSSLPSFRRPLPPPPSSQRRPAWSTSPHAVRSFVLIAVFLALGGGVCPIWGFRCATKEGVCTAQLLTLLNGQQAHVEVAEPWRPAAGSTPVRDALDATSRLPLSDTTDESPEFKTSTRRGRVRVGGGGGGASESASDARRSKVSRKAPTTKQVCPRGHDALFPYSPRRCPAVWSFSVG